MHTADWILQGLMIVLLAVTIGYCILLDRRLKNFRKGAEDMRGLIEGLCLATSQANAAVAALKNSGIVAMEDRLTGEIGKARALADELALISEVAGNTADRLDKKVTDIRTVQNEAVQNGAAQNEAGGRREQPVARPKPVLHPAQPAAAPETLQRVRKALSGLR